LVVVNFAIVNKPDRAIFVRHGLLPGLKVDDAQAAHGQANILRDIKTGIIRAAMDDLPVHPFENGTVNVPASIEIEDAANPAHG